MISTSSLKCKKFSMKCPEIALVKAKLWLTFYQPVIGMMCQLCKIYVMLMSYWTTKNKLVITLRHLLSHTTAVLFHSPRFPSFFILTTTYNQAYTFQISFITCAQYLSCNISRLSCHIILWDTWLFSTHSWVYLPVLTLPAIDLYLLYLCSGYYLHLSSVIKRSTCSPVDLSQPLHAAVHRSFSTSLPDPTEDPITQWLHALETHPLTFFLLLKLLNAALSAPLGCFWVLLYTGKAHCESICCGFSIRISGL